MKMTERITRVAEDVVQYQVTVNDPVTYVAPFTMSMPLTPLSRRRCCCPTSATRGTTR